MLTRNRLICGLKCYGCDCELDEVALKYLEDMDGMCEKCYSESMNSVYNEEWELE